MVPLLLGLVLPTQAQVPAFEDDFECSDDSEFGQAPGRNGWQSTFSLDTWSTSFHGGVSSNTDNGTGTFGDPADDHDNFLLTGHSSYADVTVQASFENDDDDAMGLVARHSDNGHYYMCTMSNHRVPNCAGGGSDDPGTRLYRVDTDTTCVDDYSVVEDKLIF